MFNPGSSAQADPIAEDECYPTVLMLRGSGEPKNDITTYKQSIGDEVFISTNGSEGPTIQRILTHLTWNTDPSKTISKLRFVGIEYPAAEVRYPGSATYPDTSGMSLIEAGGVKAGADIKNSATLLPYYLEEYFPSIMEGAKNTVDFINAEATRGCNTQYLLMGYSQGALAARVAMNMMGNDTERIIGSYLIGDPFQKANGASTERQISEASTGSNSDSSLRFLTNSAANFASIMPLHPGSESTLLLKNYLTQSDMTAYLDAFGNGVTSRSLCHSGDMVCWMGVGMNVEEHSNYFLIGGVGPHTPGWVDVEKETPGFDKQLQLLAESQTADPRQRILTHTISIVDHSTLYNLANMRPEAT